MKMLVVDIVGVSYVFGEAFVLPVLISQKLEHGQNSVEKLWKTRNPEQEVFAWTRMDDPKATRSESQPVLTLCHQRDVRIHILNFIPNVLAQRIKGLRDMSAEESSRNDTFEGVKGRCHCLLEKWIHPRWQKTRKDNSRRGGDNEINVKVSGELEETHRSTGDGQTSVNEDKRKELVGWSQKTTNYGRTKNKLLMLTPSV